MSRKLKRPHILSLSYGKDSLACLGAIEQLGWPLDRIIHAEVWATDTIPGDPPEMVEFKKRADSIIKSRWGIEVEHFRAGTDFQKCFYSIPDRKYSKGNYRKGEILGWPSIRVNWCNSRLKMAAINKAIKSSEGSIWYIGIAADEPERFHNLSSTKKSPLVELGWTESDCRVWCEKNNLLSPVYTTSARGGCWFCPNQSINQLRTLRLNHPELWNLLMEWDKDSTPTFKPNHTVQDFDCRFWMEDRGLVPSDRKFRWSMLNHTEYLKERNMARKLTSVNYDKGLPLNDLETLLLVCERLVQAKLNSNPKAGIILAKGKPNERRVRYSEAYDLLVGLSDYFGIKGAFSLGTCDSCTNFKRSHSNPVLGKCKAKSGDSASVHKWDSCPGHKGGGIS